MSLASTAFRTVSFAFPESILSITNKKSFLNFFTLSHHFSARVTNVETSFLTCDVINENVNYIGKIFQKILAALDRGDYMMHLKKKLPAPCEPKIQALLVSAYKNVVSRKSGSKCFTKIQKNRFLSNDCSNLAEIWIWYCWNTTFMTLKLAWASVLSLMSENSSLSFGLLLSKYTLR